MTEETPTIEYGRASLATIKQLEKEIGELEARIKQNKEQIRCTAQQGIARTTGTVQQQLCSIFYWHHEKYIGVALLASAMGMKVHKFKEFVDEASLSTSCGQCGKELLVVVKTRNEVKALNTYPIKCAECQTVEQVKAAQRLNEANVEYQQQKARGEFLRTMPYRDYLQTPEWQQIRLRKMKRARFCCELCNKEGMLNVHHRTYERRGHEDDKDLIVLCGTCHAKFHDKLPVAE